MAGYWDAHLARRAARGETVARHYWMHDCSVADCMACGQLHNPHDYEHWYCLRHYQAQQQRDGGTAG